MLVANLKAELETEVWECLDAVTDPELDEPITDMGFVERIEVTDAKKVRVEFRLPTYWCSPNFAFLMAFGIRKEVTSIPWVVEAEVQLNDHCFGEKVNEGVNSGRAYHHIFAEYCDGARLDEVVDTFLAKAFDRRQETVLLGLQALGHEAEDIVSMSLGQLRRVVFSGEEELRQLPRYLDLLLAQGLASEPHDHAFPHGTETRSLRMSSGHILLSCAARGSIWSSTGRCAGGSPGRATKKSRSASMVRR